MSIVTGRRLNSLYKKASALLKKRLEKIEKKLENVLHSTEIDEYIFSDSKGGFVPKTNYTYEEEYRFLRADGRWYNPASNISIVNKNKYYIDAQEAAVTKNIRPNYDEGILIIGVFKKENIGSIIGAETLLASYAYSVVMESTVDRSSFDYKDIVKIAVLGSGLSSTYGTISAVNQSEEENYGEVRIKVNKGYSASIKLIY